MSAPLFGAYGITYAFSGRTVLDEVSFELEAGRILALLGPNGSGKSTLLKIAAGIFKLPTGSGVIRHQGCDVSSLDQASRARKISYLSAGVAAEFPMTARESVALGRICHGMGLLRAQARADEEAVEWAMKESLCWGLRDRDLSTLSGGERQLVGLARALAQGSRVLLLDEALSKMDLNHVALVGRMLRRRAGEGWSVVLVAHDVNLASALADDCLLLKDGKIAASGALSQTLTAEALGKLYPGAELKVERGTGTGSPVIRIGT